MNLIHVIDADGTYLHDTYAKRAKGLVKKGRAYYVDETKICMIGPDRKDHKMENLTKEELLMKMEEMMKNSSYMKEAFDAIEKIPHDLSEEQVNLRTDAIMQIVKDKEATNQRMIALWEAMVTPVKEESVEE